MKLALSLIVMMLALIGLVYMMKPTRPKKRQVRLKQKSPSNKLPSAPAKKEKAALPQPASTEQSTREPTMEEIRFAVRKYVSKFPGVTADVMQGWMKKRP